MKQQNGLGEIRQRCRNIRWLIVLSMWQVIALIDAESFENPVCKFNWRFLASLSSFSQLKQTRIKFPRGFIAYFIRLYYLQKAIPRRGGDKPAGIHLYINSKYLLDLV